MAILQAIAGPEPGRQFTLEAERSVLGRHPDCDVVLDSGAVSRQHAQIVRAGDSYYVQDLDSRNGTFVNGSVVQEPYRLASGDRLRICDLTFQFFDDESAGRSPSAITWHDGSTATALLIEDEEPRGGSTIMSKVDVSSSHSGLRLVANPQVKLEALIEITKSLAKSVSLDDVLPRLLDSLFKIFVQADRGFIALATGPEGQLVPKTAKHRRADSDDTIRCSRAIIGEVMRTKEAILSADAATDERFEMSQSIADFRIRSMMCAPLVNSEGVALGVIQIDTLDQRSRFQQDDLEVLASVAAQAAIAIDNAQLHEQSLRTQQVQRDLELARKVQQSLLPSAPPRVANYHFFDFYQAASEVGGDFYDYIELPGGRLAIVLADVSGKGVPAAMLMAKLTAQVRYSLAIEKTAGLAVSLLNTSFDRNGWNDRFVTLVLAVLDPATHRVTVVNAGHMAPLLRHGEREVREIGAAEAGMPLGVDGGQVYAETNVTLQPGDFVTLFTDGINEAMNMAGEMYGLSRLRRQVAAPIASVADLGRHILADVKQFAGGRKQSDDMCLACFGREHRK